MERALRIIAGLAADVRQALLRGEVGYGLLGVRDITRLARRTLEASAAGGSR